MKSIFNKSTVLITGATGFIGSHILEGLIKEGCKVVILKRDCSDTWRIEHILDKISVFNVESVVLSDLFKIMGVEYVLHLSTFYSKFDNNVDIEKMKEANVLFPMRLLKVGVENGLKGFINTGTFFEYDCSQLPVTESNPIKPFNLYAKTKLEFESILKSFSDKINIITLRIFSPYGEKDNNKLISMIIQRALSEQAIQLSDGMQKLDFIYINDIVNAYISALKSILTKSNSGSYNIYNLGSGKPVSIREVVSVIEQNLGRSLDITWGDPPAFDNPILYAGISKIKKELLWNPKYSICQGIENTISYYKKDY